MSRKVLSKDEFVRKVMADLPDAKKVKAAVATVTKELKRKCSVKRYKRNGILCVERLVTYE